MNQTGSFPPMVFRQENNFKNKLEKSLPSRTWNLDPVRFIPARNLSSLRREWPKRSRRNLPAIYHWIFSINDHFGWPAIVWSAFSFSRKLDLFKKKNNSRKSPPFEAAQSAGWDFLPVKSENKKNSNFQLSVRSPFFLVEKKMDPSLLRLVAANLMMFF